MGGVSIRAAFKFGFNAFFKKFLFLLGAAIVAFFVWLAGMALGVLVAMPFFIPVSKFITKIKNVFVEFMSIKGPAVTAQAGEKLKMLFEKLGAVFADIYATYPTVLFLAVLGALVFFFTLMYISIMISMGWMKISLDIHDKGSSEILSLFTRPIIVFRSIAISILSLFILGLPFVIAAFMLKVSTALGVILMAIAFFLDFYFGLKMAFSFYFLVDKKVGALQAIKSSFAVKNGPINVLLLVLLMMVVGGVAGFGLALVLSLLRLVVLVPIFNMLLQFMLSAISFLAFTYLYRGLTSK